MPTPTKGETREKFISRFMSSEEAKRDFPDRKQRLAVANSKFEKRNSKNKESTSLFSMVKMKGESETTGDGKIYTFIGASTIPDRLKEQLPDGQMIQGEILSKNVLEYFAEKINDTSRLGGEYGSYRTISLFHNRVKEANMSLEEAGYVKPSAKVLELEEYPGNFGLFVDIEVNQKFSPPSNYPDYDAKKIEYKIEKEALSLSIEYNNRSDQERIVELDGNKYRYITGSDDFRGFGFARPNLIGNPTAVRVKEIHIKSANDADKKKTEGEKTMTEEKIKKLESDLAAAKEESAALKEKLATAEAVGSETKAKELKAQFDSVNAKVKELELKNDQTATKLKESLERAFDSLSFNTPAKTKETRSTAKIKEVYKAAQNFDFVKFKELAETQLEESEEHAAKFKETMSLTGVGFEFEKHQTLKVKCKGSNMVVVPTAKTKDVIDSGDMAESTYNQTNAMFADRYVVGITETFLKDDSLMTALPKEQHIGGNDKFQWRIWTQFTTVSGTNTLAVDPNVTSVQRTQRDFERMESRIVEYRDGVEVTDFTQHHSMAAIGDLLGQQITRAAEAVTESMNADLFKGNTEATTGWNGFVGLIGYADSTTFSTLFGKTRSAANRLLDSTLTNTYVTTSEAITSSVIRSGYEKVLAHGSDVNNLVIVIHPTQVRLLFDTEDADIRHPILTMGPAPASFGFDRKVIPLFDGIPMIRDYRCESSSAAADMFAIVDFSSDKGLRLVVSRPLGARGLAKVGTSESAYVNFWGAAIYKSPRNVFVHDSLTT